jgi:hypothetical protein
VIANPILFTTGFILFCLFTSTIASLQHIDAQKETEWSDYVSKKHGLSIQYPSNFTLVEGKASKYDPDQNLLINSSNFFSFRVEPLENPQSMTLEEYSKSDMDNVITNDDRPDMYRILIDGPIPIKVDGENAQKYTISDINHATDKSEIVQNVIYTIHDGSLYRLLFTAETEVADAVEGMENQMLNSIKWID